ncbi:MAG: hypothetical protein WC390_08200 [Sulfurimonas sp.]|jgi:hypothetical protein
MHLSSKEFFLLLSPFIASFFIYFFGQEIVGAFHDVFPSYERYANNQVDAKMEKYLEIDAKHDVYMEIENKILTRKQESQWVAEHVFYRDTPLEAAVKAPQTQTKTVEVIKKERNYTLQALFPDDKTAIINDFILKEGNKVDGAKILEIEDEKVLIKTNKGLKWLYLFK